MEQEKPVLSAAEIKARLAAVDSHASKTLECWGLVTDLSRKGLEHMDSMYTSAVGLPQEALKEIHRFRLVALTSKVLGLLVSVKGDPAALVEQVESWVEETRASLAGADASSWDWMGSMRALRDAAGKASGQQPSGVLTLGGVVQGPVAEVSAAVLDMVRRIDSEVLPAAAVMAPADRAVGEKPPSVWVGGSDGTLMACRQDSRGGSAVKRSAERDVMATPPEDDNPVRRRRTRSFPEEPPAAEAVGKGTSMAASSCGRPPVVAAIADGAPPPLASARAVRVLFDQPPLPDMPASNASLGHGTVRSAANVAPGDQGLANQLVPRRHRGYSVWTEDEEQRLIEGHELYGNQWELLRGKCNLRHRLGTQLREKMRNLVKAGVVREDRA